MRNKMDSVGLDMLLDIHGDEELPYNFINGNEVCSFPNILLFKALCRPSSAFCSAACLPFSVSPCGLAVTMFHATKVFTIVGSQGVGCRPKPYACLSALRECDTTCLNSALIYDCKLSLEFAVQWGVQSANQADINQSHCQKPLC